MSEPKWTPGPWTVTVGGGGFLVATAKRRISQCIGTSTEAFANTELIAVAPELYEALEAFATWPVEHPVSYIEFEGLRAKALIVLAKARGESQ